MSDVPYEAKSLAPDPKTVEIIRYYQAAYKNHGFRLIESIRQNKDFGNPYILTKVVEHFKINEVGSNYPKDIFDPLELTPEGFEDSFKRRRTTVPPTTTTLNTQQYASILEQATQQPPPQSSQPAQGAGPMPAVGPAQAAALAAALAAINARVADANAARRDVAPASDTDLKRKSKWGQPSG